MRKKLPLGREIAEHFLQNRVHLRGEHQGDHKPNADVLQGMLFRAGRVRNVFALCQAHHHAEDIQRGGRIHLAELFEESEGSVKVQGVYQSLAEVGQDQHLLGGLLGAYSIP